MEVASDASAWLVAITITLAREFIPASAQRRSEAEFEGVERGCELVRLLENCTGIESVAYITNITRRGL